MGGAFLTSRELFDNPIWKNVVDFRLFFLIYGQAVFLEEGYQQAENLFLNRGEWCRSIRNLQNDLEYIENRQIKRYSLSVLSRCIKRLEQSQRICTRSHELGTVFTVVNYEQYQAFSSYKKDNLERNLEQSGNSGGTVEEQSGNNNNKGIKGNKDKKDKELKPIVILSESDSAFEQFYNAYPKGSGSVRKKSLESWKKVWKGEDDMADILDGIQKYVDHQNSLGLNICSAQVFLNQERWKDDWTTKGGANREKERGGNRFQSGAGANPKKSGDVPAEWESLIIGI
jgi:hypothetical protein